jgi:hypothetical protein
MPDELEELKKLKGDFALVLEHGSQFWEDGAKAHLTLSTLDMPH